MFVPSPHRVAVLALDGVVTFDLGVPPQVLGAVRDAAGRRHYEVRVGSAGGTVVRAAAGFGVHPAHGLEILDWAETVIVPGIEGDAVEGPFPAPVLDGLRAAAGHARLVSICTGAFVLAAAGLLDGRRATTHWLYADRFRAAYPAVDLDPAVLFVDEGDLLTSAGVGAGVDLCLHLVRGDHGSAAANVAARRCVMPAWRPGGQSQFIAATVPSVLDTSTAAVREWALAHIDEPLDLAALARQARMSVRTFTRRFRAETGRSPGRWLVQQRVDRARHLLETTDLTVEQVARHSGFGTAAALRQQLAAEVGVPPTTYRSTFRSA